MTRRWLAFGLVAALGSRACQLGGDDEAGDDRRRRSRRLHRRRHGRGRPRRSTCMTELAESSTAPTPPKVGDDCVVRAAGRARRRARPARCWPAAGTRRVDGPSPVIWSPAASDVGRGRSTSASPTPGEPPMRRAGDAVHAHAARHRDAQADGRGARLPGDAARLLRHPRPRHSDRQGWAAYGHPGVGPVPARQDEPELLDERAVNARSPSTTRRPARPRDLSLEDLADPTSGASPAAVESAVVHYGDTTLTFLNNLYRADQRGTALHVRVGGRRRGEVGHRLQPRQPRRHPRPGRGAAAAPQSRSSRSIRRKARSSPTTRSSSSTRRGSPTSSRQGAALFAGLRAAAREPAAGARSSASVPATPTVADRRPDRRRERRRSRPAADAARGARARRCWSACSTSGTQQRKAARVLLVIDVSGSMGDPATRGRRRDEARPRQAGRHRRRSTSSRTRTRSACGSSRPTSATTATDVPRPRADRRRSADNAGAARARRSTTWCPPNGTPLYDVTRRVATTTMLDGYDPTRINAVVLLTDGRNEDGDPDDDARPARRPARRPAARAARAQSSQPVRIFPIAYGADADLRRAPADRRGDQRGRRTTPATRRRINQGLHRRRQQLLAGALVAFERFGDRVLGVGQGGGDVLAVEQHGLQRALDGERPRRGTDRSAGPGGRGRRRQLLHRRLEQLAVELGVLERLRRRGRPRSP